MIHEIGKELQAALRAKGCPFSVYDREAMQTATFARERIVLEHAGDDRFSAVRSQHVNPKHRRTRSIGAKLTIYAQSSASGALEFEHRRRAEAVLDMVLVALDAVAAARHNAWNPTAGRFITPADFKETETYDGAVYELLFTFDRGVAVKTWAGAIRPEFELAGGSVRSATKVSLTHGQDNDNDDTTIPASAETACGA